MKKILGYTILFLFLSTGARAQEFDLGDIMGEAQEFFGEAQEKAEHQADTEAQKKFEAAFKDKFKKWGEYLNELDGYSADTKCAYMIFKYKIEYDALVKETTAATNCSKKYDLYGMQLMAKLSSTSIIYCSEDLFNLINYSLGGEEIENRDARVRTLEKEIFDIIKISRNTHRRDAMSLRDPELSDFEATFLEVFGYKNPDLMEDHFNHEADDSILAEINGVLMAYFHPAQLLASTISISKEMDKLKPCAGL
ncbi:hypothetical protein F8C76_06625 [Flagellimonas olearia]|uniref:Uncharacterized protein n=1 Tax=Flagellimonas olearia TaxID=552546 RepID=A0A6I1EBL2_9FLAO|nr:hypothetical protein [Allomuricauda olearia]KAB7531164.1 hypothetical protein F8C76_06625 [Allomuricauda olearia]